MRLPLHFDSHSYLFCVIFPTDDIKMYQNHTFLFGLVLSQILILSSSDLNPNLMTIITSENPIPEQLFGPSQVTPAPQSDLAPGVHPRILFNKHQWEEITRNYASTIHIKGSWSAHHLKISEIRGPKSPFLHRIASANVSPYAGHVEDISTWNSTMRSSLKPLAIEFTNLKSIDALSFFMCAFWGKVNEHLNASAQFLPSNTTKVCRVAVRNWAIILLSHRAYYCASNCSSNPKKDRSFIWDVTQLHTLAHDWYSADASLALAYDVLYDSFQVSERKTINSALALLVLRQASWGVTETSTPRSPNAALHPHRIFSNWALYHSYLYITNLALEYESQFDIYGKETLASYGEEAGFNRPLYDRFNALFSAFMQHSVYPDGSTFEDGYTYFIALLPGSLGLCAASRHGFDEISTNRFRGLVHNLLQMSEPWHCGEYIGHGSGGGLLFIAYVAMFRYIFPTSNITAMLYRQRLGNEFENDKPCRIDYFQNMLEGTIFGGEHDIHQTNATSPEGLSIAERALLPRSLFYPRRGIVVMRNGWRETDTMAQFHARPDSWAVGHDNADRGVFTFTSQRQTWITDLQKWNLNVDSRKHTLLHIDGLAQDEKVPTVHMSVAEDDGNVVIAAANLTYGYNVQWARGGNSKNKPTRDINTYIPGGQLVKQFVVFEEKEEHSVFSLGWPFHDNGADLGMNRTEFALWGDDNITFSGLYTWKRNYRAVPLSHVTRSVALVRSSKSSGYLIVVDSVGFTDILEHVVESYIVLHDAVSVNDSDSSCFGGSCIIAVQSKTAARAFIQVQNSQNRDMFYRVEEFETDRVHRRIIVRMNAIENVNIWHGIYARTNDNENLTMKLLANESAAFMYNEDGHFFQIRGDTYTLTRLNSTGSCLASSQDELEENTCTTYDTSSGDPNPAGISKEDDSTSLASLKSFNLLFGHVLTVWKNKMTMDRKKFFHATPQQYQVSFKIRTHRILQSEKNKWVNKVTTCIKPGIRRSVSNVKIFYCGRKFVAKQNYLQRNCQEITPLYINKTDTGCVHKGRSIGSTVTFLSSQLLPKSTYFAVVSADPIGNRSVSVTISHTRERLEEYPNLPLEK